MNKAYKRIFPPGRLGGEIATQANMVECMKVLDSNILRGRIFSLAWTLQEYLQYVIVQTQIH